MNIFVLDADPVLAAQYHCDKHVVKMVTETAQLLSNAYYTTNQAYLAPYGSYGLNTNLGYWSSESLDNWNWLLELGVALYEEYKFRYGNKIHLGGEAILKMKRNPPLLPSIGITPRALNMPEEYKCSNAVIAYREYYRSGKTALLYYTKRERPYWLYN